MNERLLRHPLHYDNETLYSYLKRLAKENQCSLLNLYREFGISKSLVKPESINNADNMKSIKLIAEATGFDESTIYGMTMKNFSFDEISDLHMYCPICLKENSYYRIHWDLRYIKICLEHNTLLLRTCPKCDGKISLEEVDTDKCFRCKESLSNAVPTYLNDQRIINNQRKTYYAYNLKLIRNTKHPTLPFNLSGKSYIHLIMFLTKLIEPYYRLFKSLVINGNDYWGNPELACLTYIEEILENWPYYFYHLLDDLNQPHAIYEQIRNNYDYASIRYDKLDILNQLYEHCFLNPLGIIDFNKYNITKLSAFVTGEFDFMHEVLTDYFLKSFNKEFIMTRIKYLYRNRKTDYKGNLNSMFGFTNSSINLLFPKSKNKSITIGNAIKLYREIFSRSEFLKTIPDNGFECINDILNHSQYFEIYQSDIINLVLKNKLDLKISPYSTNGISALYLPTEETKHTILNLALNKFSSKTKGENLS